MGNHCFGFLRTMMNQMLMLNNIAFDREDYEMETPNDDSKEELFFDNIYFGVNNWDGLIEPVFFYLKNSLKFSLL